MVNDVDLFFLFNDPNYKLGYENGFKSAKEMMIGELEKIIKEFKKMEAFTESSSTVDMAFKVNIKN